MLLLIFLLFSILLIFLLISNINNKNNVAVILHQSNAKNLSQTIENVIKFYGIKYNKKDNIKYYYTDHTSKGALDTIKNVYSLGIRKIIGILTSKEVFGDVEKFIEDHEDIIFINGSATSNSLRNIKNIIYYTPNDSYIANCLLGVINLRKSDVKEIIILHRDDIWGKDYKENLNDMINEQLDNVEVTNFSYDSDIPDNFLDDVLVDMKNKIIECQNPCVVFIGFDEISYYLDKIDDTFKIKHFGTDGNAFRDICIEYENILKDLDFECVFYNGNIWNQKKYQLINDLNDYYGIFNPTSYMYFYYDIIYSIFLCNSLNSLRKYLSDFNGVTGDINLKNNSNRRILGNCMSVSILNSQWYTTAISDSKTNYSISDYINLEDMKINDSKQIYKLLIDKYPTEVKTLSMQGKYTIYNFEEEGDIEIPITNYVFIKHNLNEYFISNSLNIDSTIIINNISLDDFFSNNEKSDLIVKEERRKYGIIIGDSIAEGHPGLHGRLHPGKNIFDPTYTNKKGQLSYHFEKMFGVPDLENSPGESSGELFLNHGIGGQTTTDIRNRWERDVLGNNYDPKDGRGDKTIDYDYLPHMVYLHVGINDIFKSETIETMEKNYLFFANSCKEYGIKLYMSNIGPHKSNDNDKIDKAKEINDWLANQFKDDSNTIVIDYLHWASGGIDEPDIYKKYKTLKEGNFADNCRPNKDGYENFFNYKFAKITNLYKIIKSHTNSSGSPIILKW